MKQLHFYRPRRRHQLADDRAEPVDDDSWAEDGPSRATRIRAILLGSLMVVAIFFGGVQAQKHWGESSSASGVPSGVPSGIADMLASGNAPGGLPGGASGSSSASDTPAVIGKITKIEGNAVTVTDVSGTDHVVELDSSTNVTRSKKVTAADIDTGESVTVKGKSGSSGHIAATSMTLR